MTGRRLYDKHVDALKACEVRGWRDGGIVRTYPVFDPLAWPFLKNAERNMWNDMARRITPKPRKR